MPSRLPAIRSLPSSFEAAAAGMAGKEAQTVANLLVNEMIAYLKGAGASLAESGIAPAQVAALAKLLATDAISSNRAHEVFEAMAQTGDDPNKIVDERGMRQVSDAGALQPIVDEVLANCADQAQQYRDGNQKGHRLFGGPVHEGEPRQGQPEALQRVAENVALVNGNPGARRVLPQNFEQSCARRRPH